jgi:hypothetical protein
LCGEDVDVNLGVGGGVVGRSFFFGKKKKKGRQKTFFFGEGMSVGEVEV